MAVYPNPVRDNLTITVDKLETGAVIQVYNALGEIMQSARLTNLRQDISLKGLAVGMYYVQVKSGDQIFTKKIVKQ